MHLTLDNQLTGNIHTIEISADLSLGDLLAVIAAEADVNLSTVNLVHNGRPLDTGSASVSKTLTELSLADNDLILLQRRAVLPTTRPATTMNASERGRIIADMEKKFMLSRLKQTNPQMAEALEKNPGELDALIEEGQRRRRILADPMSLEAQQAIEEAIRQQNILHNMEAALEEHPESFGRIDMLYVRCLVDGHPIDAFVDTGAQMTVMSYECAERCGIVRLLDRRFEGVAVGVGTGKICGRIHSVPVKLGSQFIPCSFTVLESNAGPAVIVGLDCLRRLQATLDMRRDALLVNGEEIPFLKGADIPKDVFGHDKRGE